MYLIGRANQARSDHFISCVECSGARWITPPGYARERCPWCRGTGVQDWMRAGDSEHWHRARLSRILTVVTQIVDGGGAIGYEITRHGRGVRLVVHVNADDFTKHWRELPKSDELFFRQKH